jgi:hypothetical protein
MNWRAALKTQHARLRILGERAGKKSTRNDSNYSGCHIDNGLPKPTEIQIDD